MSDQMTFEQAADAGLVRHIVDDHHGIYVPQVFAQSYVVREPDLDEAMQICATDPDHEHYWECWSEILDNGTIEGTDGKVWNLYQDGDVWAIRSDADIDWDTV